MRGVGPLPPPGLEDAALSGGLEHPLQQALVRAAGQKTISKLEKHAEVKARVRQLGIEVGEVPILEDGRECIAQGEIGAAFGKVVASDAGGLFGHTWERLVLLERHN